MGSAFSVAISYYLSFLHPSGKGLETFSKIDNCFTGYFSLYLTLPYFPQKIDLLRSIPEIGKTGKFLTHIFSFLSDIFSHKHKNEGKTEWDFSKSLKKDSGKRYAAELSFVRIFAQFAK
jgi:hypothetical protein